MDGYQCINKEHIGEAAAALSEIIKTIIAKMNGGTASHDVLFWLSFFFFFFLLLFVIGIVLILANGQKTASRWGAGKATPLSGSSLWMRNGGGHGEWKGGGGLCGKTPSNRGKKHLCYAPSWETQVQIPASSGTLNQPSLLITSEQQPLLPPPYRWGN